MNQYPIVLIIPDAHREDGGNVELKECQLENMFLSMQNLDNKIIAGKLNKAKSTSDHHACDAHKETGCHNKLEVHLFMQEYKLAKRVNGAWVRNWKNTKYYLKKPLNRLPLRVLAQK